MDILANLSHAIDVVLHINLYLGDWAQWMGPWLYVLMFAIIFAETGLVITPFLPGDSLLFALGAMTSLTVNPLDISTLAIVLPLAAITGDNTNYFIGKKLGRSWFAKKFPWALKPEYIQKTENFYARHGAKSIVIARFAPIIRTFVPFVAGIGNMNRKIFITFSIIGGMLWIQSFLWLGRYFGNLPYIQKNFSLVVVAIIFISILPMLIEILKARGSQKSKMNL